MLEQIVQIAGSLLILAAFAAGQLGRLQPRSRRYLALNVVGSGVLALDAAIGAQWGFLLLEGVWALVSALSLVAVLGGRRTRRAGAAREAPGTQAGPGREAPGADGPGGFVMRR